MKPVLLFLSLISVSAIGANLSDGTEATPFDYSGAYQQFSFDLYQRFEKHTLEADETTNVVVSPLSAWFTLGMLQQGANTTTLNCINKALYLPDEFRGLADYNSQLIDDLQKPCEWHEWDEGEKTIMELANSFWADEFVSCKEKYIDTLGLRYRADFYQLDLALPESMNAVDAWVNEKTHGTIPSLKIQTSEELVMLLVNALYFKASWQYGTDSLLTQVQPFYTSSGEVKNVPMMNFECDFQYSEVEGFKVIRLWFGNDHRFSMTIFANQDDASFDSDIYTWGVQSLE
jgi:serpin B